MSREKENSISISEASRLMGVTEQFIRVGIQNGVLPFGYAVKVSGGKYTYFISKSKFTEATGIKLEES